MLQGRIKQLNLVIVVLVGLYGLFTDEPYLRSIGHAPWTYDHLSWFALVFNGPAWFLAEFLSWLLTEPSDPFAPYLLDYLFWGCMTPYQWRLYAWVAAWTHDSRRRYLILIVLALSFATLGSIAALDAWTHRPHNTEYFVDIYFWPVRILGIAMAGVWISALTTANRLRVQARPLSSQAPEPREQK